MQSRTHDRPILLDARPLQGSVGASSLRGIGTYVRGLLSGFAEIGLAPRLKLLLKRGPEPQTLTQLHLPAAMRVPGLDRRMQPGIDPFLLSAGLLTRPARLYHATEYGQPLVARMPVVVTCHDLIPYVLGSEYRWLRREYWLGMHLLRRADAVIVPSTATARDCEQIARVAPDRITVIPHGVDPVFRPANVRAVHDVRERFSL